MTVTKDLLIGVAIGFVAFPVVAWLISCAYYFIDEKLHPNRSSLEDSILRAFRR